MIGSAAVALHGAGTAVRDVDVLLSVGDATRLLPPLGLAPAPGVADPLFVSTLFACWTAPPLAVEFMAGLQLREGAAWAPVLPTTREPVGIAGATLFVPARAELIAILRRFGRAKDLARAARLEG